MANSNAAYLKSLYDVSKALGNKAINSDFTFEIDGFEQFYLLCKQAPWPEISAGGEVEVPGPLGATFWQPQQIKVAQQGQVAFYETEEGSLDNLMTGILARDGNGTFNAKMYAGTPDRFTKAKRFEDCFLQLDNPDRDWDNRSQVLMYTGTLFFHYYGEIIPGNVASL